MDEQSEAERAKYVRAYASPKYARNAGRQALKNRDFLLTVLLNERVLTLIDFGCGNGDITSLTAPLDVYARLIDFMGPEYLGDEARRALGATAADYTQASLWDPALRTALRPADMGVCTDVMEHIPEDRVDAVLDLIRDKVPLCFFRIAMYPDSETKIARHGGPLHVTVRDAAWWSSRLEQRNLRLIDQWIETSQKTPSKQVLVGLARRTTP